MSFKLRLLKQVYYMYAPLKKNYKLIKTNKMKTLFTLSMLILVTIAGFVSCKLFMKSHYDVSALLTLASFVSMILSIYLASSKKVILS